MIAKIFFRLWFLIVSVVVIIILSLTFSIFSILSKFLPDVKYKEYSRIVLTLGTRTGLALLPHIYVIDYSESDTWGEMLYTDKSAIILMNHRSYLDSVILLALMPLSVSRKCSFLAMSRVFEVPFIKGIVELCDFFPIYFKGDCSSYKEKQEEVLSRINQHTDEGGILAFYPEGRINTKSEKLLPFRYGGMEMARKNNNLWTFVHKGTETSWPYKYNTGGLPGKIKYKLVKIPKYDENLTIEEYTQEVQNFIQEHIDTL